MEMLAFGLVLFSCLIPLSSALCFDFKGDWWLEYDDNINITDRAHYKFSLKTTQSFGNLFFARGPRYDFERLYLEDGVLNYFLFNPTRIGNGGTFGIHVKGRGMGVFGPDTALSVADGQWHTVEFFRNTRLPGTNGTSTGIIVDGHRNLDTRPRKDVIIEPPIFIGGSRDHEMFDGVLRDFEEVRNNFRFYETAQTVSIKRYVEPPYC